MKAYPTKTSLFLWPGQGLYLGPGRDSAFHQHHAIQIGISFAQPFLLRFHPCDPLAPVSCFLAWPNRPHQVLAASPYTLFVWIEAENEIARALLAQSPVQGFLSPEQVARIQHALPALEASAFEATTCTLARRVVAHVLSLLLSDLSLFPPLDERLALTFQALKQQAQEITTFSPQHIAALLHLSESRIRHLFGQQAGLSLQRYVLWQRLLVAIDGTAHGASLTQAAHDAGFADAAHLARTFRATFGITPSSILKNSHDVQVISCLP